MSGMLPEMPQSMILDMCNIRANGFNLAHVQNDGEPIQACELMLADLARRYFSKGLGRYSLRKYHQHAGGSCRKSSRVRCGHTNPAPSIQLKPLMLQGILGLDSQTRILNFQSTKVRAKDPRARVQTCCSQSQLCESKTPYRCLAV